MAIWQVKRPAWPSCQATCPALVHRGHLGFTLFAIRRLLPPVHHLHYPDHVTEKNVKIAALIENCRGQDLDAHYLGFFECFNRGLYFEAHEVLEQLWLPHRHGPKHSFYQGLIQLAGAFVHLKKNRLRPSASLFKLARANLQKYPPICEHLDVAAVMRLIEAWQSQLETRQFATNPLTPANAPKLHLMPRKNSNLR